MLKQNATQARTNVKCADRRRPKGSLSGFLGIPRVEMNSFVKIYLCLKSPTSMYRTTFTRMFVLVPCVGVHRDQGFELQEILATDSYRFTASPTARVTEMANAEALPCGTG